MANDWGDTPSGWVALLELPEAVARQTGVSKAAAGARLRPLIETGKLQAKPAYDPAENAGRTIRVVPGGITYGAVTAEGRPIGGQTAAEWLRTLQLGWPAAFSTGSHHGIPVMIDFVAACAAARPTSGEAQAAAPQRRNSGGRPREPYAAMQQEWLRQKLVDDGIPMPGDGQQAALVREYLQRVSDRGGDISQQTAERHVRQQIEARRTELGLPSKAS